MNMTATVSEIKNFRRMIRDYVYDKNWKDAPGLKELGVAMIAIGCTVSSGIMLAAVIR